MPRLPRNVRKHGNRYEFRAKVNGRDFVKDLGTDAREMRWLARQARNEMEGYRAGKRPFSGTVKEFSERWLTIRIPQHRNAKGQRLAAQRLKDHILPVIGKFHLDEVKRGHLEELRASLEAKGLAVNSVRHILSDARSIFSYAVQMEFLTSSPFAGRGILPKAPRRAPKRLSDEEVSRILECCPERGKAAVLLSLLTGLRWGEIQRLQWRHVDIDRGVLWVDQAKSGKPRQVPLCSEAVVLLREEKVKTSSVFVIAWQVVQADGLVQTVKRRTGVEWHFHMLRHTFSCRYLEQGGSKGALQRILGHSSVTTTEVYGELSDDAVMLEFQTVMAS